MGDSYFRDLEDENIDDPLDPGLNDSTYTRSANEFCHGRREELKEILRLMDERVEKIKEGHELDKDFFKRKEQLEREFEDLDD